MNRFGGVLRGARGQSFHTMLWAAAGLAFSLASSVITARLLGPQDRGILSVVVILVGAGTLIGALGTNVALRVHLPKHSGVTLAGYRRLSGWLAPIVTIVVTPVTLVMVASMGAERMDAGSAVIIALLVLLTFLSNQILDIFNALHQTPRSARLNTTGYAVTALCLLGVLIADAGLRWALVCYVTGYLVRGLIGARSMPYVVPTRGSADKTARTLIKSGVPLLGTNVGQMIMLRADHVMVGMLLGSYAVGIYAVAATPAGILTVVANSFGQVTFAEAAHGRLTQRSLIRQVGLASAITAILAGIGVLAMPAVLPFVFGTSFVASVEVAQLLLLAQVALAPYLVMSRAVAGYGMIRVAGVAGIGGAVLLVLLMSWPFIPALGIHGAAVACIGAFLVMGAVLALVLKFRRPK